METRRRPSPATVIASIALFVALANTAAGQLGGDGDSPSGAAKYTQLKGKPQLPKNSVGPAQLKEGAVTPPAIDQGAVTASAIKGKAITDSKIKPGAITPPALAPGAITPPSIAAGAITPPAISAGAVGGTQIAQGAVEGGKIAPGAVGAGKIASGAVKEDELADDAVSSAKIKAAAILAGKLADDSVGSEKIKGGAVTTTKLGEEAVDTGKIKGGAVTSPLLGAGAVTTPKIGPLAVTAPTLATGAVGTQQLSSSIPAATVQSTSITCRDSNTLSGNHYTTELFDTANMFPGGTGGADYSLRAPVNGIYQVTASQVWAGDGTGGTRSMEFDLRQADGTTPGPVLGSSTVPANSGSIETFQTLTGIYKLTAGQSVELWTGANALTGDNPGCAGSNNTTFGNTGARASTLTMSFLNPGP
jgi:hypothetical protein